MNYLLRPRKIASATNGDDDLAADRLKNAAATKKLAIFDALGQESLSYILLQDY